jgi:uncharacterized protein (TIGR03435 family)
MKTFAILAAALAASGYCHAQPPTFEVASIRPVDSCYSPQEVQTTSDSLTVRGRTIAVLLQWAYDTPWFQITGPEWLRDYCFDVVAKSAAPAGEKQLRLMLRTLMADRFGVKAHFEQKEISVYAMTLAKSGPKFQESSTEGPSEIDRGNPVILTAHRITIAEVADRIATEAGRPVIDETGLKGRYEIHMDLSPYIAGAGTAEAGKLDMTGILFTGLQEQLGLKLESRKANVNILVVDRAEKTATEN